MLDRRRQPIGVERQAPLVQARRPIVAAEQQVIPGFVSVHASFGHYVHSSGITGTGLNRLWSEPPAGSWPRNWSIGIGSPTVIARPATRGNSSPAIDISPLGASAPSATITSLISNTSRTRLATAISS